MQTYARLAGALLLVSMAAGGFGEAYVPSALIEWRDAAATARNLTASESMFRWGFAAYLVEALCDTGLTLLFFLLLRPVSRDLALLAVFLRITSTTGFAVAQVFHFAALPIVKGTGLASAFPPDQLNALAMLSLRVGSYGGTIFTTFYGVASLILGALMYRSGYIPRLVGGLFALSGAGFVVNGVSFILAPAYFSPIALMPAGLAAAAMAGWLVVKGVDEVGWRARADAAPARA